MSPKKVLLWMLLLPVAVVAQSPSPSATIELPSGAVLQVMNTRPVWAASAKAGDPLYLQTVSPLRQNGDNMIPAGTFVAATLTAVLRPTGHQTQGMLEVRVNDLIYADGYAVSLASGSEPMLAVLTLHVTPANDLLLDNGTEFSLSTTAPLTLDRAQVDAAVALSHAPLPSAQTTATLCRFIPGTPGVMGSPGSLGTPDITIPGSPGTPDTVIPGSNGSPDTVIPGIPASPPTVIPGTPATPSTPDQPPTPPIYCPDPPVVVSSTPETVNAPLKL